MAFENLLRYLDLLLEDYRDLQPSICDIYDHPPDALNTLRMINKSQPAIIRGFSPLNPNLKDSPTSDQKDWTNPSTYINIIGEETELTIAITEDGLADNVKSTEKLGMTFVKPLNERMSIKEFIYRLDDKKSLEIVYLQSQDGNIYRSDSEDFLPELSGLQRVFKRDVDWMKDVIGIQAEAVNLWIGDGRSITSLHHDPYENIYHVLAGTKTFTLISPIEGLKLDQQFYPPSTLIRSPSSPSTLIPQLDSPPANPVPWVSSITSPEGVEPLVITVHEGETLYLPSGWWHRVEQKEGKGGMAVAINYWYTSEMNAERYAYERLTRRIARLAGRNGVIPVPGDEEQDEDDNDKVRDGVWTSDIDSGEEWEPKDWGR